jgi:thiopurine S-methyltransferase
VTEDWELRWQQGRTGWHETGGNAALKKYWPGLTRGSRVLVPLCGKSVDLIWLEERGMDVYGVELSQLAVDAFFTENHLTCVSTQQNNFKVQRGVGRHITIYCGDYFSFSDGQFDALYDRGSLVALPEDLRPAYVRQTKGLLKPHASKLVITLEYDQSKVTGPPFSVKAQEILGYWPDLVRVSSSNELENCPPKFREAGLQEFIEVAWSSV